MTEHNTYLAEHGANASLLYPTCSCGWNGKRTRSHETAADRCAAHRAAPIDVKSREPLVHGGVRYRLTNGWFIDGNDQRAHRHYAPHKYSAWEPGAAPNGIAAFRGSATSLRGLLTNLNAMYARDPGKEVKQPC